MTRTVVVLLSWVVLAHLASRPAPADDNKPAEKVDVQKDVYPFLRKHCVSCHNDVTGSARPSLTDFQDAKAIRKDRETWGAVLKTVTAGTMPPAGRPKPAKKDVERFTTNGNVLLQADGEQK